MQDLQINDFKYLSTEDYLIVSFCENPHFMQVESTFYYKGDKPYKKGDIIEYSKLAENYNGEFLYDLTVVNHLPDTFGKWVDYKSKFRYKMTYDIMLHNNDVIYGCYPNGNTFTRFINHPDNPKDVKSDYSDDEIKAIRLSEQKESGYPMNTKYSVESNYRVFDKWILETTNH